MYSTEFLKGHLCFLPFTFYSINALLFTTSNLLFFYLIPPSIYYFCLPSWFYYLPFPIYFYFYLFTTFNSILHDIVPFTVFVLLFITSNLHILLFFYTFLFTIVNLINYYIPSWFYYIPLPFYFLLLLHTFYSRNFKLNYSKKNHKFDFISDI